MKEEAIFPRDKLRLLRKVGEGAFGDVFTAEYGIGGRHVAVKRIKKELWRPENEAAWRAGEGCDLFPRVFEVFCTTSYCYIVMEYIEGITLKKVVSDGGVSRRAAVKWLLQICEGISHLHHLNPPMVYCDVKPQNVMLSEAGKIRIIDLDAVRTKGEKGPVFGTRGYAAPVCCRVDGISEQADVYALGVLLYVLLTGRAPGRNMSKREGFGEVGDHLLECILGKCVNAKAGGYTEVEELMRDLKEASRREVRRSWQEKGVGVLAVTVSALLIIVSHPNKMLERGDHQSESETTAAGLREDAIKQLETEKQQWHRRVTEYRREGRWDEAAFCAEQWLDLEHNGEVMLELSDFYMFAGRYEEAGKVLEQLRTDPETAGEAELRYLMMLLSVEGDEAGADRNRVYELYESCGMRMERKKDNRFLRIEERVRFLDGEWF